MKPRILLIGAYGSGNLGDDLLYEIVINSLLKFSNAQEIAVLCKGFESEYLAALSPGVALKGKQHNYKFEVDLLIYGGGTQFFKYEKTQSLISKIVYGLTNPYYSFKKLTKTLKQEIKAQRTIMLGVGFGPFENGTDFSHIVKQLRACDFIWSRDDWSNDFCLKHGAQHASLGADMAFSSFFRNNLEKHLNRIEPSSSRKSKTIGIIVRDWPYGSNQGIYISNVIRLAQQLKKTGNDIKFILFSREKDLPFDEMKTLGDILSWSPTNQYATEFIADLSSYKCIITSRYHGAVFSVLVGCPVIGINIDPKIEYFFQQIQMQEMLWNYPFDIQDCLDKINLLNEHSEEHLNRIVPAIDRLTKLADNMIEQFEKINGTLASKMYVAERPRVEYPNE